MRVFRSKSKEINEEDIWYYHTERCIEVGKEYDPKLEWFDLESESEVNNDQSSGCGSGVLEGSSSKYFAPSGISDGWPINIKFIQCCQMTTPSKRSGRMYMRSVMTNGSTSLPGSMMSPPQQSLHLVECSHW